MNNNNPLFNMAMNMLGSNPAIKNSPQGRELMDILQSNDSARGQKMAENLLKTYGISKEEALNQAKQFFNIR